MITARSRGQKTEPQVAFCQDHTADNAADTTVFEWPQCVPLCILIMGGHLAGVTCSFHAPCSLSYSVVTVIKERDRRALKNVRHLTLSTREDKTYKKKRHGFSVA